MVGESLSRLVTQFMQIFHLVVLGNAFQKKTQKTPKLEIEKAIKSWSNIKMKNNITTLDQILDNKYGKKGAPKREEWEQQFEAFRMVHCLKKPNQTGNDTGRTCRKMRDK